MSAFSLSPCIERLESLASVKKIFSLSPCIKRAALRPRVLPRSHLPVTESFADNSTDVFPSMEVGYDQGLQGYLAHKKPPPPTGTTIGA